MPTRASPSAFAKLRRCGCRLDGGKDGIGRRRPHVHLNRRERRLIERGLPGQPFGNPHGAKRRRPVARHHARPARVDLRVGRHHLPAGRIQDGRQPFDRRRADPVLLAGPASRRRAAVAAAAQGHAARHRVADVSVHVGVDEVLRRRREAAHAGKKLGPVGRAVDGLEPASRLAARLPAQRQGPGRHSALERGQVGRRLPLGFGVEQRAVARAEVLGTASAAPARARRSRPSSIAAAATGRGTGTCRLVMSTSST